MALVLVRAARPHCLEVEVEDRQHITETVWQAQCQCGWKSPSYPPNDRGTAQSAAGQHDAEHGLDLVVAARSHDFMVKSLTLEEAFLDVHLMLPVADQTEPDRTPCSTS